MFREKLLNPMEKKELTCQCRGIRVDGELSVKF